MNVQERIKLLVRLGEFMHGNDEEWQAVKHNAFLKNQWFIPQFIELAVSNIDTEFLQQNILERVVADYEIKEPTAIKKVGLIMAGNIPLVGFHDFLCVFISGNCAMIKLSSKDDVLLPFLLDKLIGWNEETRNYITIADTLKTL